MSFWYRSSIQKVGRGVEKRRKRSFSAEIENLIGAQQKKICVKHLSGKTASTTQPILERVLDIGLARTKKN